MPFHRHLLATALVLVPVMTALMGDAKTQEPTPQPAAAPQSAPAPEGAPAAVRERVKPSDRPHLGLFFTDQVVGYIQPCG
jgi:hypothetical protein